MDRQRHIQLNSSHFFVAIVAFAVLTYAIGKRKMTATFYDDVPGNLIELHNESFQDSISLGDCFVLFYVDNSDLCAEMSRNLGQLAENSRGNRRFFRLNVDKHPECVVGYNISGVPNIFIFRNGKEHKRIMGLVPIRNLEIIYRKLQ